MQQPEDLLIKHWGFNAFRPLQKEIIDAILEGKDCFALLPTGGGKSVCYQVPAMMMAGICLVVSPLIALMQDQVNRLKDLEIPAALLHAGMHFKEVERTLQNAVNGAYQLLYLSPERLQSNYFKEFLEVLHVSFIAVDEAHCISQWGHDFRPEYRKIAELRDYFPKAPILALTASATVEAKQDIIAQLELKQPKIFQQSFSRDNIFYDIHYSENKIGDALEALKKIHETSIVYCRSRKQTELLSKSLNDQGLQTIFYHAGMTKEKRTEAQELWTNGKVKTIVATTAFGMGIDKADVRLVIHFDAPENPEAYYQEAGRVGRDGKYSKALSLFHVNDIKRLEESTALKFPPENYLRQVYQSVCEYLQLPIGVEPNAYFPFSLHEFCSRFQLKANQALPALKILEQEELWTMTEAVYQPSTIEFLIDRKELDDFIQLYPDYARVITGLLRLYGNIFLYPTPVNLITLGKHLNKEQDTLKLSIQQLHQNGLLEYIPPKEGAQIFFQHLRADSRFLKLNWKRIDNLKQQHLHRTKAMIDLLCKDHCREQFLLNYFGEKKTETCGHCDYCAAKKEMHSTPFETITSIIMNLLQQKQPQSLSEICVALPTVNKQEIAEGLRFLLDKHHISRNEDGNFLTF